jgi:YVTN family beta-propeller protein
MPRCIVVLFLFSLTAFAHPPQILILHKGDSSLGFYSSKGEFEEKVAVGKHPHEMVLDSSGKFLYCTDNGTMQIEQAGAGGNTVSIVDVHERKKVGEISLGKYRRPHGIDINPKTGLIYVSTELPDQLLVIDPEKRQVIKTYDTKGKTDHMVKLGPEGKWAYVSHSVSNDVGAVELATGKVKLIKTGARPEGSTLAPDGKLLYVVNREAAQISIIDTAAQSLVGTIKTANGPVRARVTDDNTEIVYALYHDKAVGIADLKTRTQLITIPLAGQPVSLDLSEDGRFAFASAQDIQKVYVINIKERKISHVIETPPDMFPDPVMVVH